MTRPIYESDEDREAQQRTVEVVQICWRCTIERMPPLSVVDYRAERPNGVAFIEIKVRTNPMRKYDEYMISLAKIEAGIALAAQRPRQTFILVVNWRDDAIGWVIPRRGEFKVGVGGRTDRGDVQDIENMAFIPVSQFKLFDAPGTVHREWWAEHNQRNEYLEKGGR